MSRKQTDDFDFSILTNHGPAAQHATSAPQPNGPSTWDNSPHTDWVRMDNGMTWREATKVFFLGSNKRTRAVLIHTGWRVWLFASRFLPLPATAFLAGDDVTGIGVADDPALIVTTPMMVLTIMYALYRIPKIHREGNPQS